MKSSLHPGTVRTFFKAQLRNTLTVPSEGGIFRNSQISKARWYSPWYINLE